MTLLNYTSSNLFLTYSDYPYTDQSLYFRIFNTPIIYTGNTPITDFTKIIIIIKSITVNDLHLQGSDKMSQKPFWNLLLQIIFVRFIMKVSTTPHYYDLVLLGVGKSSQK